MECAAAPPETKAQDADRAALAGTGLEGLFDPAPAGDASPTLLAGASLMRRSRAVDGLKGIAEISGACVCVISPFVFFHKLAWEPCSKHSCTPAQTSAAV